MDSAELRRKNFIPKDAFPYTTEMGAVYDSGDYEKALDLGLKASDWEGLKKARDAARAEGRLVGLGLSMYVEVCGIGPSATLPTGGWEHAHVTIERDGRITAATGASPHGQGNETTFAQMLADQFGVPLDHITIQHGDTSIVKQGIGTFGSRSQAVGGAALNMAGAKVKAKMAKFAASLMEASEEDLVFQNGTISVAGAPAAAFRLSKPVVASPWPTQAAPKMPGHWPRSSCGFFAPTTMLSPPQEAAWRWCGIITTEFFQFGPTFETLKTKTFELCEFLTGCAPGEKNGWQVPVSRRLASKLPWSARIATGQFERVGRKVIQ